MANMKLFALKIKNKTQPRHGIRKPFALFVALSTALCACSALPIQLDTIAQIAATPNPADNPPTPTVANWTISTAALVKERSVLRVGIRFDAPPLSSVNADGKLEGLDVDIAREFARRWLGSPNNVTFVQVTSFTAPQSIERREVDLAMGGLAHTKPAEAHADFGLTYMHDGEALLVRVGTFANLASLAQHSVTYIDNSSLNAINSATASANITVSQQAANSYSAAIQQLRDSQTDAVLGRWRRLRVVASQDPTLSVLTVLDDEPIAIMLPQNDSNWVNLVNFTLSALIADGTYASMYQKWFGAPPDPLYPIPGSVDLQLATLPDTIQPHDTLERLKSAGALHVGFIAQADPLATLDANGQAVGFEVDLCRELARRWFQNQGAVHFTALPGSDLPGYLRNDTIDLAIGALQQTQSNERVMDFSIPTYETGVAVAVLQSSVISDLNSLTGHTVGVLSDRPDRALLEDFAKTRNLAITIDDFPDLSTALGALRNGQVDAVVEDQVTLLALARTAKDVRILAERLSRIPVGIALPTNDSPLRDLVNLTLQEMFADGTYARIYKQWFGRLPDTMEIWPGEATESTALIAPTPTTLPTLTPAFSTLAPPTPAPATATTIPPTPKK